MAADEGLAATIEPVELSAEFLAEWKRSPLSPPDGRSTFIAGYMEASEILRSRSFRTNRFTQIGTTPVHVVVQEDRTVRFAEVGPDGELPENAVDWAATITGDDTLSSLHGDRHRRRRRALSPLFGRDAHRWYRDVAIEPTVRRVLEQTLAGAGADGIARVDLVKFSHRLFVALTCSLIGLDGGQDEAGARDLTRLFERMDAAPALTLARDLLTEENMTDALAARDEFQARWFAPSLAWRRELVAQSRRGELPEEDLPRDYLTLVAQGAETFEEESAVFNQTLPLFSGSTGTSTLLLLHTVNNLLGWFDRHPEDLALQTDSEFLGKALRETIRLLNPGIVALTRVAVEDVVLSSGRQVSEGETIVVLVTRVNRDVSVFGPHAAEFRIDREAPQGFPPYALGFGGGAHMCPASPIVLGDGGVSGTIVPVVSALLSAGLALDPDRPVERRLTTASLDAAFVSFPVLLRRRP